MTTKRTAAAFCVAAAGLLTAALASSSAPPYTPTDAERARWTLSDMRSYAFALAAYKKDHGSYPAGSSLDAAIKAIEPAYIRKAPAHDAWGTPYRYLAAANGDSFTLASAGSDGSFSSETWVTEASDLPFDADAVMTSEGGLSLTRVWQYR
jgi:hypothetical protein